jgi:oligopeptidase B
VLDLNRAFTSIHVRLGTVRISSDHTQVALTLDVTGRGAFGLYTHTIGQTEILGPLAESVYEVEWGGRGALFYTTLEGLRATKLFRLEGGRSVNLPVTLRTDGHLALHGGGAPDTLIVRELAPQGGQTWRVATDERRPRLTPLRPAGLNRAERVIDGCVLGKGTVFITQRGHSQGVVWQRSAPRAKLERLIDSLPNGGIEAVRCFRSAVFLSGRANFRPALWTVTGQEDRPAVRRVALPFGLTDVALGAATSPTEPTVRLQMSSPITPPILYTLDLEAGSLEPQVQMRVRDHSAESYTLATLTAVSADGTSVPVTIAYRDSATEKSARPALLSAYGAYGIPANADFAEYYLPLLERGFVIAIAHVRGGGEGGPAWHAGGRLEHKHNGPSDFIAAAEALRRLGWGTGRQLAAVGRSAGAIVVAGAVTRRPDLFGAVVLEAPFLDIVEALGDDTRPLAVRDRAEWGDPRSAPIRSSLERYAPFETSLAPGHPPTLVSVGLNDESVNPLDGARWIDRLASHGSSGNLLVVSAGTHAGPPTRSERSKEEALKATFVITQCGDRSRLPGP